LCNYADIATGRVTLADCFAMHGILDWREHCEATVQGTGE
jgi:hypothetical protein